MSTWGDLSIFTYGDIAEMKLTWGDLHDLSQDELLAIAKEKLEKFKIADDEINISSEIIEKAYVVNQTFNLNLMLPEDDSDTTKDVLLMLLDKLLDLGIGIILAWFLFKLGF